MPFFANRFVEMFAEGDGEMKANFESVNRWNVFMSMLSGNILPMTSEKTKMPVILKLYVAAIWTIELAYLSACVAGIFYVPKEKALRDSTVNFVVTIDILFLLPILYSNKDSLKKLIRTLNEIFAANDKTLRTTVTRLLAPLMRVQQIYIIGSAAALFAWTMLPLIAILHKNQFYCTDYQIPMILAKEPFSVAIFVAGTALQIVGGVITFIRKASLDVYTMHWILLMTAQYKYMELKFISILEKDTASMAKGTVSQELRLLTQHHKTVVKMAAVLKQIFSPNIAALYINNVFRFCFLSIMVITSADAVLTCFIVLYACGALMQLYMMCFCIQRLLEASTTMMDSVFHKNWYEHDIALQRSVMLMILATKLKCQLSRFRSIDLTLPSFMSILNQAYSVCLLFLKSRRD
ncbi:uncharacterized protein LOC143356067 isoform X1 [Halictus rubicundus]|uniref:uncharacterized protein LOC143356067 isoform X1 n=1 Tax=Halictus rubicundus TaxID=77578 RepID=UPI0040363462